MGLLDGKSPPKKGVLNETLSRALSKGMDIAKVEINKRKNLDTLIEKAKRGAFLLKRIAEGDHKALGKAVDASDDIVAVLKEMGVEVDWE